ncbi:MAG: tetratricopeptide repeat protein [Myxococcaceae bacterium]
MTLEERAETEARADRSLRRGELTQALAGYDAVLRAFPDDEGVRRKLDELKESVDPVELRHPKANFTEAPQASAAAQTPEQEGERLFAQGDYPGAIAAYRRALALRPDAELVKERLGELFRLVQAPRRGPASAAPDAAPSSLPADADGLYRALLERISSRRRP